MLDAQKITNKLPVLAADAAVASINIVLDAMYESEVGLIRLQTITRIQSLALKTGEANRIIEQRLMVQPADEGDDLVPSLEALV